MIQKFSSDSLQNLVRSSWNIKISIKFSSRKTWHLIYTRSEWFVIAKIYHRIGYKTVCLSTRIKNKKVWCALRNKSSTLWQMLIDSMTITKSNITGSNSSKFFMTVVKWGKTSTMHDIKPNQQLWAHQTQNTDYLILLTQGT